MKYFLLIISLLLINCTGKKVPTAGNWQQGSDKSEHFADSLILDGKPYMDSRGKVYRKDEAHLVTSIACYFSPDADIQWQSFEGMEQLINLENLSIECEGEILTGVDFTPLASLPKLESLCISGEITCLPDLTKLTNLRTIFIGDMTTSTMLESLEGIGAPNVIRIVIKNSRNINSFAPLNNLFFLEDLEISIPRKKEYKISEMANLPSLKHFNAFMGKIDLQGIENMSALEILILGYCEPFNIEGIGKLENLEFLSINLISPEPSLEFLRNKPNLLELYFDGDEYRYLSDSQYVSKAYQILDVSPLATLNNIKYLRCRNFIIKNISALDILKINLEIDLIGSSLLNEKEKSKHNLVFESYKE